MLDQQNQKKMMDCLMATELLENVSDNFVKDLTSIINFQYVKKGQILLNTDKSFDDIIIVLDGELSLRINKPNGNQIEIRIIYKNGILGEVAFANDDETISKLKYLIVVSKEGLVLKISRKDLFGLCYKDKSGTFFLNLLRIVAKQLHASQSRMRDLAVYKVEELVRIELQRLASNCEKKSDEGVGIVIPSNQELALRVGCHKRMLIFTLNKLRNSGEIIRKRRGSRNLFLANKFFERSPGE